MSIQSETRTTQNSNIGSESCTVKGGDASRVWFVFSESAASLQHVRQPDLNEGDHSVTAYRVELL